MFCYLNWERTKGVGKLNWSLKKPKINDENEDEKKNENKNKKIVEQLMQNMVGAINYIFNFKLTPSSPKRGDQYSICFCSNFTEL